MHKLTINPSTIHELLLKQTELLALDAFFKSQKEGNKHLWIMGETYNYSFHETEYSFTFSQSLIRRKRKKGKEGDRFDIVCPELLGEGGYGAVYPITGTLKFEINQPQLKPVHNKIVKVQFHDNDYPMSRAVSEYSSLAQANHLKVKPLVFIENEDKTQTSFIIMEKAKGISLETILDPKKRASISDSIPKLTTTKRLEITLAILRAIKTQVTDRNIVHRDLKPSNIMIDLKVSPPVVTIIDYGLALTNGAQDYRNVGTRAYRSPESFNKNPTYSAKSDVYEAGRVLSYLWGDLHSNYYFKKKATFDDIQKKSTNRALFSNPDICLFQYDKVTLKNCIFGMMNRNYLRRDTIDDAIEQLSHIKIEKYNLKKIQDFSQKELEQYEINLKNQFQLIQEKLMQLELKAIELRNRNNTEAADILSQLHEQLNLNTTLRMIKTDPTAIPDYKNFCFTTINDAKKTNILQTHRDIRWLLAEITTAIALLGIGYLAVVGVNYCMTGRFGLFAQTKSEQMVDEIQRSIDGITC